MFRKKNKGKTYVYIYIGKKQTKQYDILIMIGFTPTIKIYMEVSENRGLVIILF